MGTSITIIASALEDFPALADTLSFQRTGKVEGGLPPVGYSESNGNALIWIDQTRREDLATIDFGELSRAAPIWVFSVFELDAYSILERYENGATTCGVWSITQGLKKLEKCGTCPFNPNEFERHCLGPETRAAIRMEGEGAADFEVPVLAFRDLTGVEYDGEGSKSIETADASFPEEAWA